MNMRKGLILAVAGALGLLFSCHRHHHHDTERMLKRLDSKVEDLELTQDQSVKYQEIRSRLKADLQANRQAKYTGLRKLKEEFNKENPDVKGSADVVKKQLSARQPSMNRMVDYFVEFYAILDARQQAEVNSMIKSKLKWARLPEES